MCSATYNVSTTLPSFTCPDCNNTQRSLLSDSLVVHHCCETSKNSLCLWFPAFLVERLSLFDLVTPDWCIRCPGLIPQSTPNFQFPGDFLCVFHLMDIEVETTKNMYINIKKCHFCSQKMRTICQTYMRQASNIWMLCKLVQHPTNCFQSHSCCSSYNVWSWLVMMGMYYDIAS